jgi:dihydrofolate reductase
MRKLKLQMQLSIDGFVAGPNSEMDWMVWDWDDELKKYVTGLTDSVDMILLGRKMTAGFISHWSSVVSNPADPGFAFGRKMIDKPKVVFTKTLDKSEWENTILATGNLVDEISKLKNNKGKDIIVYGGAGFVSSLINADLIDEYHLFINPAAIGRGLPIFSKRKKYLTLKLANFRAFECGIVVHHYEPRGQKNKI